MVEPVLFLFLFGKFSLHNDISPSLVCIEACRDVLTEHFDGASSFVGGPSRLISQSFEVWGSSFFLVVSGHFRIMFRPLP